MLYSLLDITLLVERREDLEGEGRDHQAGEDEFSLLGRLCI
jgi:hypothetical protein